MQYFSVTARFALAIVALLTYPAASCAQVAAPAATRFTAADYLADIDELHRRMLDQSSYLQRRDFDHEKAFTALRESITDQTDLRGFVYDLHKLIMQIRDCHAEIRAPIRESTFLPFRPADTADGLSALSINLDQPHEPEHPYLESIDGLPLEAWISAAAKFVAHASPQLIRCRSLDWIGRIELMRVELGLANNEIVEVGLKSADGARQTTKRLRPTRQGYSVARLRLKPTRTLEGNIGYLRIPTMDDRLVDSVVSEMKSFQKTSGLIIDVRDNGGGTYGIMRAIYGFFVPDDAPPKSESLGQSLRVLVVEDNVDAADSLSLLLRLHGHEVQVARTGPTALEMAEASRPDLVLLDIGLPGMDGYQVAKKLREKPEFKDVMLCALTGFTPSEADRHRQQETGFNHYYVKPLDMGKLLELFKMIGKPA